MEINISSVRFVEHTDKFRRKFFEFVIFIISGIFASFLKRITFHSGFMAVLYFFPSNMLFTCQKTFHLLLPPETCSAAHSDKDPQTPFIPFAKCVGEFEKIYFFADQSELFFFVHRFFRFYKFFDLFRGFFNFCKSSFLTFPSAKIKIFSELAISFILFRIISLFSLFSNVL